MAQELYLYTCFDVCAFKFVFLLLHITELGYLYHTMIQSIGLCVHNWLEQLMNPTSCFNDPYPSPPNLTRTIMEFY